jgi:hypothetical protein
MQRTRFIVVNRASEEFLDPRSLGEKPVEGTYDRHDSNTMKALAILMCRKAESDSPLSGRWAGDYDSIETVDDTDEEYDLITENRASDLEEYDEDEEDEDYDPDYPYPYLEVTDPDIAVEIEDTPFEEWMIKYASEFYSAESLELLGLDT